MTAPDVGARLLAFSKGEMNGWQVWDIKMGGKWVAQIRLNAYLDEFRLLTRRDSPDTFRLKWLLTANAWADWLAVHADTRL